ncbi:protein of unknown function [Roseateles sp. YR242]|uniref:DUF4398 domain-containing protein n=1 Tax=Roseateles sp. YR242 TaxID=1855305 RepID=UPI0008BE2E73|nr:DUF4398 domain-containing protein [Roseateles sp. YR242]SEK22984.1 protein of unknown function [Roseateles sp. YR242]
MNLMFFAPLVKRPRHYPALWSGGRAAWAPLGFALLCMVLMTACASPPRPDTPIAVAEAAVKAADTPETQQYAGRQLQMAIGKLEAARTARTAKDYAAATRLADEAQLDAQTATTAAAAAKSRQSAEEAQAASRALAEELARQKR